MLIDSGFLVPTIHKTLPDNAKQHFARLKEGAILRKTLLLREAITYQDGCVKNSTQFEQG